MDGSCIQLEMATSIILTTSRMSHGGLWTAPKTNMPRYISTVSSYIRPVHCYSEYFTTAVVPGRGLGTAVQ